MENTDYKGRRERLTDLLDGGIAIICSSEEKIRNFDAEYTFRQDSNLKYLLGINEPESILVLHKKDDKYRETLFLREKNPLQEQWCGKRLGTEKALEIFELDTTYSIESLCEKLPDLIQGHEKIFFDIFSENSFNNKIKKAIKKVASSKRATFKLPQSFHNLRPLIGSLRLIKDQNEVALLKKAAHATAIGHKALMAYAKEGITEGQAKAFMEFLFKKHGGPEISYNSIVATGDNATILHYVENDTTLKNGDLLLVDAGNEYNCYASDVTRMIPVNGKFSEPQKELYQLVLDAQKSAISLASPGHTLTELHNRSIRVLTEGMIRLGLLKGDLEENIEKKTFHKYFPHGTGHWLGLDVHDECPYSENGEAVVFRPGMVFTVEPGVYVPENDFEAPEKYRGIGIRIEDDILITDTGHINLTAMIPKEVSEVEAACNVDPMEFLA